MESTDYNTLKDKKYRINEVIDGEVKRVELTGGQIVDRIENVYKNHFDKMYNLVRGNQDFIDSYQKVRYGKKQFWDFHKGSNAKEVIYDYKRVVKDIFKAYENREDITTEFGPK